MKMNLIVDFLLTYLVFFKFQDVHDQDPSKRRPDPQSSLPVASNVTRVLLFAYYRGGSSFIGDLFNHNPDVFYWFEPLAGITNSWGEEVWSTDVSRTREWFYYRNTSAK